MLDVQKQAPRLTRLELQGFKSFASRTLFLFEPGITAIIGPNGSGKSNISDAVRWVLGEQSHNLLRSKKTEDVIFAGGQAKAPLGWAEVTVTFDNSTGWLPTDFAEVTITRRATRGGENQFLINGRKVRMKDVQHLTATLGQSYTVVGQGLVDAALSQRAEDRRGLFEHAADLAGLRMKAQEAQRNLNEAESNASRIADLLAEAEPRLRSLERAAKQAREWQGVHDRLRTLQQAHYKTLLQRALAALANTEVRVHRGEEAVRQGHEAVERLTGAIAQGRLDLEDARKALVHHLTQLQTVSDQSRRIEHERELASERLGSLQRRRADMTDTEQAVQEQASRALVELETLESALGLDEAKLADAQRELTDFERSVAAARSDRAGLDQRSNAIFTAASHLDRRIADAARRRDLLAQRRESDSADHERITQQSNERNGRIARLVAELASYDQDDANSTRRHAELESRMAKLIQDSESADHNEQKARQALAVLEKRVADSQARLDALQTLADSGAGLYAGAKAVLLAARAGELQGVRGTLAELIEVPTAYDTALEVALGGRLQDIVVDRWVDAEAAIILLKTKKAGRATFQPIETVRTDRASTAAVLTGLAGVAGIAADLVRAVDGVEGVVRALLGRTVIVDDLVVARTLLPELPGGWNAVTLAGEIVRAGGSVSGGVVTRENGALARERELRELPLQLATIESERETLRAALGNVALISQQLTADRLALDSERASIIATRRERTIQRARLVTWLDELSSEAQASTLHGEALFAANAQHFSELASIESEEAALLEEQRQLEAERIDLDTAFADRADHSNTTDDQLKAAARDVAALEERIGAERRRQAGLQAQRTGLAEEIQIRSERAAALDGEMNAIRDQQARLQQESSQITEMLESLKSGHVPLETQAKQTERRVGEFESALGAAHETLLEAERNRGEAGLSVERVRSEVANVRQRIEDDLELLNPEEILDFNVELDVSGDDAEREIYRLKERLRRVGYIGEEAVEEFQRESERHSFLTSQLADVRGASTQLQQLLDDLQTTMQGRFEETFARVAEAFSNRFTALFGGGQARLVLVEGEEGEAAGVDIVAQPPGKRLQSLALLSGGERALTAAALLFAILEVNPSPFALLDEVDAALDEANVVRFRQQLQALAAETQAIIITHNRGTIEVADTLYGVSMGENGVSQVLSLRMATEDPATAIAQ